MDYSASGGIGKEGLSVVDGEAGRKITAVILHVTGHQYHPLNES